MAQTEGSQMTIATKTHTHAGLKLAAAATGVALALAQADPFGIIMQGRAEALRRLEAVLAKGEASIAELQAILPLLEGFVMRLLEDAIECGYHVAGGGHGDVFSILQAVVEELKNPRHPYQPGRSKPKSYPPLASA
jgi:hypothetical protein